MDEETLQKFWREAFLTFAPLGPEKAAACAQYGVDAYKDAFTRVKAAPANAIARA